MFRAKTVFVLGAGSSYEVGMPIGSTLLEQIVQLTHLSFEFNRLKSGDYTILESLKILMDEGHSVEKLNEHISAGWQLTASAQQAISIDNVIDALEDEKIELLGKMGIVRAILKAESDSNYFKTEPGQPLQLEKFKGTWYDTLTKLIVENVRKSEIESIFDNLEIINFNYDRCIEHYLSYSISKYYGTTIETSRSILSRLKMHRPYGTVGRLPWQDSDAPSTNFGECSPEHLAKAAQQVRTFTEQIEDGATISAIKRTMISADRIVFLGFAFHRQNVDLLSIALPNHTEILATAYQISKSDQSVIERELSSSFEQQPSIPDGRIELSNLTCHQLFLDYWRTLTSEKGEHQPLYMGGHQPEIPDVSKYFPSRSLQAEK